MTIPPDPVARFKEWFAAAQDCGLEEPASVVVASVDDDGYPAARVCLLRGWDERGLVFYTNLQSDKGRQLLARPKGAMCFHWMPLVRQVRVRGDVSVVDDAEADAYFAKRERESQLGAWASHQSQPLESRAALMERFAQYAERFAGQEVPRPPHWSGFRLVPNRWEFWHQEDHRLHVRELYVKDGDGWKTTLLNP